MLNKNNGILICRTDKIGDLVLSIPAIKTIIKAFPDSPVYLMVSSYASPVVENMTGIAGVIKYDDADDLVSEVDKTKMLIRKIVSLNCTKALMLVHDSNVLNIIKKAGIKERFGPLTKVTSIFSYTKWIAQHRSNVEKHELEYNMDLLRLLGIQEDKFDYELELNIPKYSQERAKEKLKQEGFTDLNKGFIIIHATMSGSALNWKYAFYSELASRIFQELSIPVILTGSEKEKSVVSSIKNHIAGTAYDLSGKLSLVELIGLISLSKLFVGPSTGPMHIAAACGVPVVSIFSPVKVQTAKRWGPYSKLAVTVSPNVDCPGKLKCLGDKCENYFCMDSVSVENVFDKVKDLYVSTNDYQMSLKL